MVGVLASHPDKLAILVQQNRYWHKHAGMKRKEHVGPANAEVESG
jgi:hypothetical protein